MEIPRGYAYLAPKTNNNDGKLICYLIIFGMIFYILYPRIKFTLEGFISSERSANVNENVGILPQAIRNAICHPKCCIQKQWPVEHMNNIPDIDLSGYVQTEYSCRSCVNGSGCLCMTKEDHENMLKH